MKDNRKKRKICLSGKFLCLLFCMALFETGCRSKAADELTELELEAGAEDVQPEKKIGQGDGVSGTALESESGKSDGETTGTESRIPDEDMIFVHVCGAVQNPGVYKFLPGVRLYEALAKAGGVREDGAAEALNQARELSDGERIYVPTSEEVEQGFTGEETVGTGSSVSAESSGKMNINTASRDELMTLPGIGETKAESILSYREANGGFQSIEGLMQVEGIKEGTFNKIKDRITVGE